MSHAKAGLGLNGKVKLAPSKPKQREQPPLNKNALPRLALADKANLPVRHQPPPDNLKNHVKQEEEWKPSAREIADALINIAFGGPPPAPVKQEVMVKPEPGMAVVVKKEEPVVAKPEGLWKLAKEAGTPRRSPLKPVNGNKEVGLATTVPILRVRSNSRECGLAAVG